MRHWTPPRSAPLHRSLSHLPDNPVTPFSVKSAKSYRLEAADGSLRLASTTRDFSTMLELPPFKDKRPGQTGLAQSLFELSITLRSVGDVLAQLETFVKWAPLRLYSYSELIDLIHAAKNCPVDVLFQLLEIGGKMIEAGNFPNPKSCEFVDKIICDLHSRKVIIPCYGSDQQAARDELKRLHALFVPHKKEPAGDFSGKWKTPDIERVVRRQQRRAAAGMPPMTDAEVDDFLIRQAAGRGDSDSSAALSDSPLDITQRRRLLNVTAPVSVFELYSPSRRYSDEEDLTFTALQVEVVGCGDWPDRLEDRVRRGLERFRTMDERHRRDIRVLAALFTRWEDAYESSKTVWQRMKTDPEFDIDVLVSQMQFASADFLVDAITHFMMDEGFVT